MTADLDRGLVQEPSSEGAPTRRDARAALACSVLVAVGFAVSVLVTVGKGNLDVDVNTSGGDATPNR